MKKIILILVLLVGSSALAQSEYAILSKLVGNTIQADKVELVTPQVAASRGAIPASDARHYKKVFVNQNPALRQYTISAKVKVTLLTFPNFVPKTTTLATLKLQLENSEKLPSEFLGGNLFALTLSGNSITAIREVNTRAITGVFEQAVLIARQTTFNPFRLVLDFVFVYSSEREMRRDGQSMEQHPAGLYISNNNPALRSFAFAKDGRILLLKNVGAYISVGSSDLRAGLDGTKEFGWGFDWNTPFQASISDVSNEVLELRQIYLP
ncbi:MAG: hypothetical protein ACK41E_01270 [Deinococcales bacterium]